MSGGGDKMSLGAVTKCHGGGDKMSHNINIYKNNKYTDRDNNVHSCSESLKETPEETPKSSSKEHGSTTLTSGGKVKCPRSRKSD